MINNKTRNGALNWLVPLSQWNIIFTTLKNDDIYKVFNIMLC